MRTKLLILCAILLCAASAQAQDSDPLPPPDPGMQWQQTFGDEFNGTAVDTSKWNGQFGGGLQWCGGGTCVQDYSNVVEANGVVQISPGAAVSGGTLAHGLNTGGPTAAQAKFSQRFGYFSASAKEPPYGNYDGAPLWFDPIGKFGFPFTKGLDCNSPGGDSNEEIDFGEGYNLGCPGPNCVPNIASDPYHMSFSYHDCQSNTPYSFFFPGNVDTSAGFHTYGLWWRNDGSAHGSFTPFFDGTPISSPIPTDPNSNLWDNGVYILLNEQGQPGPPLTIDWVHVYQQVPTNGTPTPTPTQTPTPTATPTPGGGSFIFASPAQSSTVSGTITVSVANAPAGTSWVKYLLPNPPANGQCSVGQFDSAWGGCSLYTGTSFAYDTTILPNGASFFQALPNGNNPAAQVNFTVQQGAPPPPTFSFTSPAQGSVVSGTINVAVGDVPSGTNYIKYLLPNQPVNGQCAFGQFDNAWGGCSLYTGTSFSYDTTLMANGGVQFQALVNGGQPSTTVNANISN